MLKSIVREALVVSVAKVLPPVSFHTSQQSIVPMSSSPCSACWRAPSTLSSSHFTPEAEKLGSMSSPLFSSTIRVMPRSRSSWHSWAPRVSCHTTARAMGLPVVLLHTTAVSRWLVRASEKL